MTRHLALALLALLAVPAARAQSQGDPPAPRDPTQPSEGLRQAVEGASPSKGPAPNAATQPRQATPAPARPIVPKVLLRGRIVASGRPPVALVDVGGVLYVVRTGTEISVSTGLGEPILLRVVDFDGESLQVRATPPDQTFIVR